MGYPGGKAGPGVYQALINQIPPHDVYVACFAGRDAITQYMRPAGRRILIDLDPEPLDWWSEYSAADDGIGDPAFRLRLEAEPSDSPTVAIELHCCDGMDWLRYQFGLTRYRPSFLDGTADPASVDRATGDGATRYRDWFIYLDPPYLLDTRSSGPMYRHEMTTQQHQELLAIADRLPCMVMICGYPSELYDTTLGHWRRFEYQAVTRSGEKRTEVAWCNYPEPKVLHDARYVGSNKREREKVRRRIRRLSSTLLALPDRERQAVLDAVAGIQSPDLATLQRR